MAIARVQATPVVHEADGAITLTFPGAVTAGNVIVIPIINYRNGNVTFPVTPTDNQGLGNTYQIAADARDSGNTPQCQIYYIHNVASGGGTFTITITTSGAGAFDCQIMARAIEYSGFGTVDPLVGSGTANGGGNNPSVSTGATGSPEVLVVACCSSFRLNFDISAITVDSFTPAFTEEYELLAFGPFLLAGEANTRIDNTGTASGVQTCSWTVTSFVGFGGARAIAAFYSDPPDSLARVTQIPREVLEQDGNAPIFVTQIAREVLYPFTCENNGPTPSPTGCPDQTVLLPVTPPNACPDEV